MPLRWDEPLYARWGVLPQLSQIFQHFGEVRYAPADPLLRSFVPKMMGLDETRSAAVWALGKIHEGKATPDLATLLTERLSDMSAPPPEADPVRAMSAVSLGHMKAASATPALRLFSTDTSQVSIAAGYALHLLTGERRELPPVSPTPVTGWFLEPVN